MNSTNTPLDPEKIRADLEQVLRWNYSGIHSLVLPEPSQATNTREEVEDSEQGLENASAVSLRDYQEATKNCQNCDLHAGRKRVVHGTGSENARLMLVLPPPTMEVESSGSPYAGRSGELLRKMIQAIRLDMAQIYSTPILKCAPRKGRSLDDAEVLECLQHLRQEIQLVQPEFILGMGELAARTLLRTDANLDNLRGNWDRFLNIPLLCTWDPEVLVQSPDKKREAWADLKMLIARMG